MVVVCGQHPPKASASSWKVWNSSGPRLPCPAWWRPARPASCAVPPCWKVQVDAAVPDVERVGDVGARGRDTAESAQHILGGVENRLLGQVRRWIPRQSTFFRRVLRPCGKAAYYEMPFILAKWDPKKSGLLSAWGHFLSPTRLRHAAQLPQLIDSQRQAFRSCRSKAAPTLSRYRAGSQISPRLQRARDT